MVDRALHDAPRRVPPVVVLARVRREHRFGPGVEIGCACRIEGVRGCRLCAAAGGGGRAADGGVIGHQGPAVDHLDAAGDQLGAATTLDQPVPANGTGGEVETFRLPDGGIDRTAFERPSRDVDPDPSMAAGPEPVDERRPGAGNVGCVGDHEIEPLAAQPGEVLAGRLNADVRRGRGPPEHRSLGQTGRGSPDDLDQVLAAQQLVVRVVIEHQDTGTGRPGELVACSGGGLPGRCTLGKPGAGPKLLIATPRDAEGQSLGGTEPFEKPLQPGERRDLRDPGAAVHEHPAA